MDEHELKHWGILNMKWGVRRFQNPDGSLTPEGRLRYGVGLGRNVGAEMSDEELRKMTNRYRNQANFYKARNDFIESQNRYEQLTKKPPSFISKFLNRFLLKPLGNVAEDSVEYGLRSAGAALVEGSGSKYADQYVDFILKRNKQNNSNNGGGNNGGGNNGGGNNNGNRRNNNP